MVGKRDAQSQKGCSKPEKGNFVNGFMGNRFRGAIN